ncbi:hypothetical protein B0H99_104255 [Planomicrobium soli]|uniref:Uncharacterized protein n=1 Tax=Planomicrobium soli TaxID=1176648 RepID=A0A2P8H3L6_9BACL|nr:hypothetical protein [Planomicrobium soli]PSL40793.1 hypothetical protein B0H99_104255 [Planomicrobium soli]
MTEATDSEALRKILNLNRNVFNYLRSPLLIAYEFFNPNFNIDEGLLNEKTILNEFVYNSKNIFLLKSKNPLHYAKEIIDQLKVESAK